MVLLYEQEGVDWVSVRGDISKPLPCDAVQFGHAGDAKAAILYYGNKTGVVYRFSKKGEVASTRYWVMHKRDYLASQVDPAWGPVVP